MQALRLVMLLAAVPVCYLLFFPLAIRRRPRPPRPRRTDQYKHDLDQARDAARQMQAQKAEADAQ